MPNRSLRLSLIALVASLLAIASSCHRTSPTARPAPVTHVDASAREQPWPDAGLRYHLFADESEALRTILASQPRIVGVGEVHQSTDSVPVRSAVEHFIGMLDAVAPAASDLVVETWVQTGRCGEPEQAFARDVPRSTNRPPEVQNLARLLLLEARRRDIAPHVLTLDCHDYARLTNDAGSVDLEALALLLGRQLKQLTARLYRARAHADAGVASGRAIWIYGGALHNDIEPEEGFEAMSYAADLSALSDNRYVELDLFVPEYIRGSEMDVDQPWYPLFERFAGPDHVVLIERSPRSFILIFRTQDRSRTSASMDAGTTVR